VAEQHGLDFARVDVLTAPDDHFPAASLDADVAAFIHRPEVAGAQPAVVVDRRRGGLGVTEVSGMTR
jgi:hypothetical protein